MRHRMVLISSWSRTLFDAEVRSGSRISKILWVWWRSWRIFGYFGRGSGQARQFGSAGSICAFSFWSSSSEGFSGVLEHFSMAVAGFSARLRPPGCLDLRTWGVFDVQLVYSEMIKHEAAGLWSNFCSTAGFREPAGGFCGILEGSRLGNAG